MKKYFVLKSQLIVLDTETNRIEIAEMVAQSGENDPIPETAPRVTARATANKRSWKPRKAAQGAGKSKAVRYTDEEKQKIMDAITPEYGNGLKVCKEFDISYSFYNKLKNLKKKQPGKTPKRKIGSEEASGPKGKLKKVVCVSCEFKFRTRLPVESVRCPECHNHCVLDDDNDDNDE